MNVLAVCDECRHWHGPIDFDPLGPAPADFRDWSIKHAGHMGVRLECPRRTLKHRVIDQLDRMWRWRRRASHGLTVDCLITPDDAVQLPSYYAGFLHNADIKLAYGASFTATITLASLAASSTWLAGRESTAIDNGASNKYLDYLVAAHFLSTASNVAAGSIRLGVVAAEEDTPTWPDVFDGTDSVETVSSQGVYDSVVRFAEVVTAASAATYAIGLFSLESLFGKVPDQFTFFVSHTAQTSTNAWSSTESAHKIYLTGVYGTVI